MSQNSTVICRRSLAGWPMAGAAGMPHCGQKRAPGGRAEPHPEHPGAIGTAQYTQERAPATFSRAQAGHFIGDPGRGTAHRGASRSHRTAARSRERRARIRQALHCADFSAFLLQEQSHEIPVDVPAARTGQHPGS